MSATDREVTRVVRSWLHEDEHENADRVLDLVLDQLDTTPQRRAGWPARRHPIMNAYLRAGAAAAALLFAAVIGISVFGGGPNVLGPGPTATPSASVSPSPSLQAWVGSLQPGRNEAMIQGVRFSFRIPSEGGWVTTQYDGMIRGALLPERWIGFLNTVDSVATDPCTGAARAVGPSVADLADALTTIPGTEAQSPTDATVGGLPAKLVTFTINDDIGCAPSSFLIYGRNSAYPNGIDSTIKVWVFELDGKRYTIHTDQEDLDASGTQEIADIVDSIQFE